MKDRMTAQELGNLIGVTASRIRELTRVGVLARDGDDGKTYLVERNVKAAFAHLRAGAAGRGGKAAARVSAERAGLLAVQRKLAEHKFARECGASISASEFGEAMTVVCIGLKLHFMQVPSRVAGAAPHLAREDIHLVKEVVWNALGEVSEMSLAQVRAIAAQGAKELAP